jgi:hypothetical protein
MKASVRVMRSYDYCHFEVTLGSDDDLTLGQVDDLRKQAALLVDEAVRQYKIAKRAEEKRQYAETDKQLALDRANRIRQNPQSEWGIEDAAFMRSFEDKAFWKDYEADNYYYEDDPERDHHFSMLRKFEATRVSA